MLNAMVKYGITEQAEKMSFFGYEFTLVLWESGASAWMYSCGPGDMSPKIFITDTKQRAYRGGGVWDLGLYRGLPSCTNGPILSIGSHKSRVLRWPQRMRFEAHREDGFKIEFLTDQDIVPAKGFGMSDLFWILSLRVEQSLEVETSRGLARIVRSPIASIAP